MVNVFLWGFGINSILLIVYYFLHSQIEKFSAIRERKILSVRKSRAAYYQVYFVVIIGIALLIYLKASWLWEFIFISLAILIFIDILHDRVRLVLTPNELISVRGFLSTKATGIEYKDIVIVEVFDDLTGRMFGFGNIKVTVGGGSKELIFKDIPHYLRIKNTIEQTKIAQERGLSRRRK